MDAGKPTRPVAQRTLYKKQGGRHRAVACVTGIGLVVQPASYGIAKVTNRIVASVLKKGRCRDDVSPDALRRQPCLG